MSKQSKHLKKLIKRLMNGEKKVTKKDCLTLPITDLEQVIRNESMVKKKDTPLDTRCSIHIHSKRFRFADSDGISAKAAIDGLVHGGLLQDDSPSYVSETSFTQEKVSKAKGEKEETIIYVYEDK